MEFSVVVPLYNEETSLKALQDDLGRAMDKLSSDYEIIYVDDGSTDSSLDILEALGKKFPKIRAVSFKENRGQSTALFAGFHQAKGDWLITLDADLQNPPEEISKLLEFKNDFDFITGVREKRKDSVLRKVSSSIARFFRWLILRDHTKDTGCSLRIFKREIIDFLPPFNNFHRFFVFLVRASGFRVKEVPVAHRPRRFGESKYGTWGRAKQGFFDLIGLFWLKRRMINYEIKDKC